MVITLFDMLRLLFTIAGCFAGFFVGQAYGTFEAIAGVVLGLLLFGYLGWLLDRWNSILDCRKMHKELSQFSSGELRSKLGASLTPNYLIMELRLRGEDVSEDLEPIFRLLEAEESFRRTRGWAAFRTAYPELTTFNTGYSPASNPEKRRERVNHLRGLLNSVRNQPA